MEVFIEEVRSEPVLYDTGHEDYMKKTLKDEIWNRIARDLKLKDGSTAKNTWLKLRKCHRDALKRKKQRTGSAATTIKPWKYEKQMEFLLKFMTNRATCSNISEDLDFEYLSHSEASAEMETELETNVQTPETLRDEEENSLLAMPDDQERELPPSRRKRKPDVNELLIKSLERHEKRASEREAANKLQSNDHQDDELFQFFMSMYNTTKKMPPLHQVKIKKAIFTAVNNEEEQVVSFNMSSHSSYSTSIPFAYSPARNVSSHNENQFHFNEILHRPTYEQTSGELSPTVLQSLK